MAVLLLVWECGRARSSRPTRDLVEQQQALAPTLRPYPCLSLLPSDFAVAAAAAEAAAAAKRRGDREVPLRRDSAEAGVADFLSLQGTSGTPPPKGRGAEILGALGFSDAAPESPHSRERCSRIAAFVS